MTDREQDLQRRKEAAIMIGAAGFVIAACGLFYLVSGWLAYGLVLAQE